MPVTTAAVVGGSQAALGMYQAWQANKLRKQQMAYYKSHSYQIPASQIRATNIAGKLSKGTKLPGQDIMEENLAANTAQSVSAGRDVAVSPAQVQQMTIDNYLAQQEKQQQLDLQAANNYQARLQNYANAVASLAPYEEKKYQYDVLFPVQAQLGAASGMGNQGMANIGQGINSALSTWGNSQYLSSMNTAPTNGMSPMSEINAASPNLQNGVNTTQLMPMSNPNPWWGGGYPNTTIQQRQGTF